MSITLPPLPEPVGIVWSDGIPHHTYAKGQLHAHAAAVSAARDAEIAQLRADAIDRQNNVVMPLRERVRVLEDALRRAIVQNEHDMLLTGEELRAARAALEQAP